MRPAALLLALLLAACTSPAALPVGAATRLQIGNGAGVSWNGPIRQIRIYPYAANDNELAYRSAGNF